MNLSRREEISRCAEQDHGKPFVIHSCLCTLAGLVLSTEIISLEHPVAMLSLLDYDDCAPLHVRCNLSEFNPFHPEAYLFQKAYFPIKATLHIILAPRLSYHSQIYIKKS